MMIMTDDSDDNNDGDDNNRNMSTHCDVLVWEMRADDVTFGL